MKRWWLGLWLVLGLGVFTACGNFSFQHPIGIPTVVVSIANNSLTQNEDNGNWTLSFELEARTMPGSPGGVILEFGLENSGTLAAGRRVERCPADSKEPCGPFTTNYTLEFASYPPPGSFVVVSYKVMGENGSSMEVRLPAPLRIH